MDEWLCPFCGLKPMAYGATCEQFRDETCEHMSQLNVNGWVFLKMFREKKVAEAKGTGISQISDE